MKLIGLLVLCFLSVCSGGFIQELRSPRGMDLGGGFHLRMGEVVKANVSLGPSVQLDYGSYGVSVGRSSRKDAYEIGFHSGLREEGRGAGKKMGEMLIPALVGFKVAGITTLVFAGMGAFTLKALGIAKVALILASILLIPKLFGHYQYAPKHIAYDAHSSESHPIYAEFPEPTYVQMTGETAPFLAYANYPPSAHEAVAESSANYAIVESPSGNNMTVAGIAHPVLKRRDEATRRKAQAAPVVTVRKYTIETK